MATIEIIQGDLLYKFIYDPISQQLSISCKNSFGYIWSTILDANVVAKSQNCDTLNLSPEKIYEILTKYKNGTLSELVIIVFQKHVKGLNASGYFDSVEEYYQVEIPFEIKIVSVIDEKSTQHSLILLKADKSITDENINKNRISRFSTDINKLDENYNNLNTRLSIAEKNTEDLRTLLSKNADDNKAETLAITSKIDTNLLSLKTELNKNIENSKAELNNQITVLKKTIEELTKTVNALKPA